MSSSRILISGNEAVGEGAIKAGCRFYAGYPITPQNELTAYMAKRLPEVGGVFIQAESELAAINMVLGASAAGARAMTTSSSPGISLMQEAISYMAGMELPAVIVNIMRGGPGLGNIAGAQGDYFQATKGGGHGDYRLIVLAPSCVQEMADFTQKAFYLAFKYKNPVMVLADGYLGQMMEPAEIKEFNFEDDSPSWRLDGAEGREPRLFRSLYLPVEDLEGLNIRLQKKYTEMRREETWREYYTEDAEALLVAYGTCARVCREVVRLGREEGRKWGLFQPITLWPYPERRLKELGRKVSKVLVVEMSSGQMVEDVRRILGEEKVGFYGRMGGALPVKEEIWKKLI
ncbi:3-methyl-2-oxobutanoate dehydrogenase subunit VorB [Candidatus Calescamantes bacterium]|nr:3-methyl-2-oxobutanoate dehydrogenase subunit VorB [Candidatus Calescamantes bacterium]